MTEQANPNLGKIEDVFKLLVWDVIVNSFLTYIFTSAPWTNAWPLRQFIISVVDLVANNIFSNFRLIVDLNAVKLINQAHQKAFDDASVKLKIIAYDKGVDSPEFQKAREDGRQALSKFVRFGSVTL